MKFPVLSTRSAAALNQTKYSSIHCSIDPGFWLQAYLVISRLFLPDALKVVEENAPYSPVLLPAVYTYDLTTRAPAEPNPSKNRGKV